MATATMKDARITARVMAQHRHLDTQIENLERKNFHNRELIIDLKKQKLKIKDRLASISLREERQSKKELESRYKNIQLDLFNQQEDNDWQGHIMLHKISDFVKRISVMHDEAQRLHKMKYESPKGKQEDIDNAIGNIQALALSIAKDKSAYSRHQLGLP